ncbi:uncharacterized protein LOC107036930 isoform X2 [Diachasma alloeum]|uniref:uncharacterized protein LOC107036930 isoform X2 n=1 Tax=Diachasma alloeum TaxID=454923 RepID=UPI0007381019|nr:uncharacterized protein LOC107036930 isoform X2 [Diachasma alloeum]XP_015110683.1 uncharacterized protein LOC107036930 isoform X2 [Diachasma alloeum]
MSLMRDLGIGSQFNRSMQLFLVISVVVFPYALGEHVQCYANVESTNITTPKSFVHCISQCGKADVHLSDGSYVIVRSCGEFFADMPSLLSRPDLRTLSQDAKTALSRMSSRDLHLCKKNLCNEAHLSVSPSWLVAMTIIAAVIGMGN